MTVWQLTSVAYAYLALATHGPAYATATLACTLAVGVVWGRLWVWLVTLRGVGRVG